MTKFSALSRQCCLDTMDSLMKHPIAAEFHEIEIDDETELPKEFDIRKQSTGLKQAREKLAMNKYSTISQWEKDVRQVFLLIEKLYSDTEWNVHYSILAREMEHLFKKYEEYHLRTKTPKWASAIVKLNKKLEKVFEKPPPVVIANTPLNSGVISLEKPFSEDEMNSFVKYSKFLNSEEDSRAIVSIIRRYQPEIKLEEKHVQIDVSDLKQETMLALRKFFTERLAGMNIQYPH